MTKYELRKLGKISNMVLRDEQGKFLAECGSVCLTIKGTLTDSDIPILVKWIQENFIDELPKKCEPL